MAVPLRETLGRIVARVLAMLTPRDGVWATLPAHRNANRAITNAAASGPLTPAGIAQATADLLWAQRGALKVETDTEETFPRYQRHSHHSATATVTLPGGIRVRIPAHVSERFNQISIQTPDGQIQNFYDDTAAACPLVVVWRHIQCDAVFESLGIEDGPARAVEHPDTAKTARLAKTIGDLHRDHEIPQSEETWLARFGDEEGDHLDDIEPQMERSTWNVLGNDILGRETRDNTISHYVRLFEISHPTMGSLTFPYDEIARGLEERKSASFANALGLATALPTHLPMPRGNAKAARILRICRDAVAAEPDLVDAAGTPIAPLVQEHLPALMRRHAEAAAIAPADQLDAIDAELADGIEIVRRAVDEALEVSAMGRRKALQTELGFLRLRHPDEGDATLKPLR